jgi:hypothetical protein
MLLCCTCLQAWHKLLLQPFSKHPILTLSAASSRAVAYLSPDDLAQSYFYQHETASSSLGSLSGRRLQGSEETSKGSRHVTGSSSSNYHLNSTGSLRSDPQRKLQQQQKSQLHTLSPEPPVTVYGRCFESLTVCKLTDPRGFPDSVTRPVWSGAQFVRQFWEQQYGAKYKVLLPQHQVMKQGGALRVVVAVRGSQDVRSILNIKVRAVSVVQSVGLICQFGVEDRALRVVVAVRGSQDVRSILNVKVRAVIVVQFA